MAERKVVFELDDVVMIEFNVVRRSILSFVSDVDDVATIEFAAVHLSILSFRIYKVSLHSPVLPALSTATTETV